MWISLSMGTAACGAPPSGSSCRSRISSAITASPCELALYELSLEPRCRQHSSTCPNGQCTFVIEVMVTKRRYHDAGAFAQPVSEDRPFFCLWIFTACASLLLQAKMVSTLSNLNVEYCEGRVRVRALSVGGETAFAEETALHAAL